jgi:hypothetical protein
MPVKLDTEPTAIARAVRAKGRSTRPGDYVDVEFGETWATERGRQVRVPGQWRQCQIERVVHSELHVRLSPDPKAAPPKAG